MGVPVLITYIVRLGVLTSVLTLGGINVTRLPTKDMMKYQFKFFFFFFFFFCKGTVQSSVLSLHNVTVNTHRVFIVKPPVQPTHHEGVCGNDAGRLKLVAIRWYYTEVPALRVTHFGDLQPGIISFFKHDEHMEEAQLHLILYPN